MRLADLAPSPGLVIHPILKRTQTPRVLDRLRGCDMIRVEVSPYRLAWSRTQAFQAWYMGSNPVRGTNQEPGPVPGFSYPNTILVRHQGPFSIERVSLWGQ